MRQQKDQVLRAIAAHNQVAQHLLEQLDALDRDTGTAEAYDLHDQITTFGKLFRLVGNCVVRAGRINTDDGIKYYTLGDVLNTAEVRAAGTKSTFQIRAVATGQYRQPKAGEWYVSGAVPTAYRSPSDLSQCYHIVQLVRIHATRLHTVLDLDDERDFDGECDAQEPNA
jgi:hypothetical protein